MEGLENQDLELTPRWCETVFYKDYMWFSSHNHKGSLDDDWLSKSLAPNKPTKHDMEEFYVRQECNMSGEYYRVIGKRKDDDITYIGSYRTNRAYFDIPFSDWKPGDVVKHLKTQKEYIVFDKCNTYEKALVSK